MSQAGTVTWLAVRELWISFRLVILLVAFIAVGAVVALVPAPLPDVMQRLAIGLGVATVVVAALAAWSLADERVHGRAGWLVTRSVSRGTLLGGWFVALASVALAGLIAAGILGWLAASGVSLRLDPAAYTIRMGAVAATVVAAAGLGLLLGAVARPALAAVLAAVGTVASGLAASLLPTIGPFVPGYAFVELARLTEGASSTAAAWLAAGVALLTAAVLLVLARIALDRVDL